MLLVIFLGLVSWVKGACFESDVIVEYEQQSDYLLGPAVVRSSDTTALTNGKYLFSGWFYSSQLPQDMTGSEMLVMRAESTVGGLVKFVEVVAKVIGPTEHQLISRNDAGQTRNIFGSSNVINSWFFLMITHSNDDLSHIILAASPSVRAILYSHTFLLPYNFDATFSLSFAGKVGASVFFHGTLARISFIRNLYSDDAVTLNWYRTGVPRVKFVLDFSDPEGSQFFTNRVEGDYAYATNGRHNHTDPYDFFYNPAQGWGMRHFASKISVPKIRDFAVEKTSFAYHISFTIRKINADQRGYTEYGLFSRYKVTGSVVSEKIKLSFLKENYSNSIILSNRLGGTQVIWEYSGCDTTTQICSFSSFTQTVNCLAGENSIYSRYGLNGALNREQTIAGSTILFE